MGYTSFYHVTYIDYIMFNFLSYFIKYVLKRGCRRKSVFHVRDKTPKYIQDHSCVRRFKECLSFKGLGTRSDRIFADIPTPSSWSSYSSLLLQNKELVGAEGQRRIRCLLRFRGTISRYRISIFSCTQNKRRKKNLYIRVMKSFSLCLSICIFYFPRARANNHLGDHFWENFASLRCHATKMQYLTL